MAAKLQSARGADNPRYTFSLRCVSTPDQLRV